MAISAERINEIAALYYEEVYKFCCAKVRNADDAADLTQDSFALLLREKRKLEDKNIRSWLMTTSNNLIHEYFRRQKKEQTYVRLEDADFVMPEKGPAEKLTEEEFEKLLNETQKKILSILDPTERELFIKLYIEKKSVKLVAEETGMTENNVYVRSHRLKKKAKDVIFTGKLFTMVVFFKIFSKIL